VCESSPADEFLKHGSLLGPGDLEKAAEKVMQALGRGKITPNEGGKMMNILASRAKIIETVLLDGRVARVEERMDPAGVPLAA
jgi:hypothetical protein